MIPVSNRRSSKAPRRRGAMLVFVAMMLTSFLFSVVLTIDLAYMHLARTELRSATDAAAKAASITLADTQDTALARASAKRIGAANTVVGAPLQLADSDFSFGRSLPSADGKFSFSQGVIPFNSVEVTGDRRSSSLSGSVGLFFGSFSGKHEFEPVQMATATYMERDIALVIDLSGSMAGQKVADLEAALGVFTSTLRLTSAEELVGLASYHVVGSEDVPMTTDLSQVTTFASAMTTGSGTSISAGMDAGMRVLSTGGRDPKFVERTMIVMTDGNHNTGAEPALSAIAIADEGVKIHTITFGAGADIGRMQTVASLGSGKHFHADTGSDLISVYQEIALTLTSIITE